MSNILVTSLADMVAIKEVLGQPKAFLYRYSASPEQCVLFSIYGDVIVFRTNTIAAPQASTPAEILAEFPNAVGVEHLQAVNP